MLWLLPGAALGQTSTPPDPNEGAFGQTISGADATPPNIPVVATPRAAPAGGPGAGTAAASIRVAIDRPADSAVTPQRFTLMGWAVDPEGTGSGVDAVHVYLDGEAGLGQFLGAAEYGGERLDVASQLGQPRFGLSGYQLQVELAGGEHTLYVYARRRGAAEPRQWSAPATVGILAVADGTPTSAGRQTVMPGACARAPDGACLNRPSGVSPTCQVIDTDGQCVPTPRRTARARGATQPSLPGANSANGPCTQYDASNRCLAYANTNGSTFNLRAEGTGQMTTLTWSTVSGTVSYEVLRCNGANAQNCLQPHRAGRDALSTAALRE